MAGKRYELVIGIDPDVDLNGVALLFRQARGGWRLVLTSLSFARLIRLLYGRFLANVHLKGEGYMGVITWDDETTLSLMDYDVSDILICVEAGWKNRSNWHVRRGQNNRTASAIGQSVGRNHEVGRKLVEVSRDLGFDTEEILPFLKCWKGKDGKITHEELVEVTGFSGSSRTTQEERDAGLIAFHCSGISRLGRGSETLLSFRAGGA